jgi:hypothetical protein
MTMHYQYATKLIRVECAARVLLYARDNMPGDDLGQEATALAMIELREAIADINEDELFQCRFDAKAALEELKKRRR